jgi:HPt (histidine-containing phosphotransfer) domain-containing protein
MYFQVVQVNSANTNAVDIEALRDLVGDDIDEIKSIYAEFLEDLKQVFVKLIKSTKAKDYPAVKHDAHYLKTSAYAVGTHKLAKLLESIESAALKEDDSTLLFCIGELKEEAIKVQTEIKTILKAEKT